MTTSDAYGDISSSYSKHSLTGWEENLRESGLQARRLAVAPIRQHLTAGYDVVVGQHLARNLLLKELEQLAARCGAQFVEAGPVVDAETLAQRLAGRRAAPNRAEQAAKDRFVGPDDAPELVRSIDAVLAQRIPARRVDARGNQDEMLAELPALLVSAD